MSDQKIIGHTEPRIYTPPLRKLTPKTSLGFAVSDFARDILKEPLYPWQDWLVKHALEIRGSFDTEWTPRFRTVVAEVARRNGKTHVSKVLALFWLYILEAAMVVGTAQSLSQAEEVWKAVVKIAENNPSLAAEISAVRRANGSKELALSGDRRYKVQPTTHGGGRGDDVNLLLMDELREHYNWESWAAVTPTVLSNPKGIVWSMSNAGVSSSVVLRTLRMTAHKLLGDPDGICERMDELGTPQDEDEGYEVTLEDTDLGWFEWSAPPGASKFDEEAWAYANPSLNIGGITSSALRGKAATNPDGEFKTEYMCQWVEAIIEPPFPKGAWEAGIDDESFIARDSNLYYGIDISTSRDKAAIAVCGMRPDRKYHVEVVAYRSGTNWIQEWFADAERQAKNGTFLVGLQGNGAPISSHISVLEAVDNVEVVRCEGRNLAAWTGRFYDAVSAANNSNNSDAIPAFHIPQAALDLAANIAQMKTLGDGNKVFNRDASKDDISPLIAAAMAYGLATEPEKQKKRSVYEDYEPAL